ncbi:MAG: tripartite tricarboxylate transporter TctB family protein [Rhizobiaceae bacterium]|nr:tripartite tricarboxylate transporter TctB family protein [Rhizobiaceae bacterium]
MDRTHFTIGLGACMASVGLYAASLSYRVLGGGPGDPGTMFMPRLVLVLIFLIGLWSCVSAVLWPNTHTASDEEDDDVMPGITLRSVIAMLATAAYLYAFRMELYFWATPLYLAFVLWLAGIRNWKTLILLPALFTLMAYFGFYRLLAVPLLTV